MRRVAPADMQSPRPAPPDGRSFAASENRHRLRPLLRQIDRASTLVGCPNLQGLRLQRPGGRLLSLTLLILVTDTSQTRFFRSGTSGAVWPRKQQHQLARVGDVHDPVSIEVVLWVFQPRDDGAHQDHQIPSIYTGIAVKIAE